ncbi:MAG: hypothetical protein HYZ31_07230 [Gammaproteobacteria bacterium]|nr:hypothetical protein [Gammaproteobacteria bacterium]
MFHNFFSQNGIYNKYFSIDALKETVKRANNELLLSLLVGACFIICAVLILANGHLHEDAYILFQYSKKVANGEGIVFDDTAGHTEGATDFLWMMSLALLHRLHIDIGNAAAILNGIGLSTLAYVILRIRGKIDPVSILALTLVIFSGGTAAALGGFSTLAYGGLFSLFALSIIQKHYRAISLLATIIPLFRPDGVLLVMGGIAILLITARKDEIKASLTTLILPLTLGSIYFYWRYNYFESLLPLPLLVKARTNWMLEGLWVNIRALNIYIITLAPLILFIIIKSLHNISWRNILAVGLGPALLFLALSFAHQSQNVGFRFQFPIIISIVIIFTIFANHYPGTIKKIFLILPILGVLAGSKIIYKDAIYLTNEDYINSFPQILKAGNFEVDNIAITEAGRFPYWYDSKAMTDLIGLNTAKVIHNGSYNVIVDTKPDLIFVHHASRFDTSSLDKSQDFVVTASENISLRSEYLGKDPVSIAPESALKFAASNHYNAVFVRYGKKDTNFSHVYFLSPTLDEEKFIRLLRMSIATKLSYYDSIKKN